MVVYTSSVCNNIAFVFHTRTINVELLSKRERERETDIILDVPSEFRIFSVLCSYLYTPGKASLYISYFWVVDKRAS